MFNCGDNTHRDRLFLHYPSLRTTTLASLVKGEVLLLSFAQPTIEKFSHQHH